jgi:hypothetical protein
VALTAADYNVWSRRHGETFGFSHPNDPAVFARWYEVFAAAGYTAAELGAATDVIAMRPEPLKWRDDHLAAIHAALRSKRSGEWAAKVRSYRPDESEVGECAYCGGSGWAVVPHPKYVMAGEWSAGILGRRPTAAVTCLCHRGRAALEGWDRFSEDVKRRVARPMPLEHYQAKVNPGWRNMIAGVEAEERARLAATAATQATDAAAGPLARAIRGVVGRAKTGLTP